MIVKIWPIKAKYGSLQKNLKDSVDYIKDNEKMVTSKQGQDLQLKYENLLLDEKENISWEEFKINNEDNFNRVLTYTANEDKTDGYVSGYLCDPEHVVEEFIQTKQINLARVGKVLKGDTGNHAYHLVQSFPEELNISDEEVHRCGQELLEKLGKYQGIVCSHIHPVMDEENEVHGKCKHNHIIINSHIYHELIDPDNPAKMKYNDCKETYALLQLYNDQIAIEHGLPIVVSQDFSRTYSWFETKARNKGKSWKARVKLDIENTMRVTNNIDEYIKIMENDGYSIRYGNSKQYGKYIVYTTPNGEVVRDYILGKNYQYEQLNTYWEFKNNLALEVELNNQREGVNPLHTILSRTQKQIFIDIKRNTSVGRRKKLEEQGKVSQQYYHYHLPVPTEYTEDVYAEKTYFDVNEQFDILNENKQTIATISGLDVLNYYSWLEKTKAEQNREDEYYIDYNFYNSKTNTPYHISRYNSRGERRSLIECLCLLAIVILNKEDEYFGVPDEEIIFEKQNDPIYAKRAWKLQNMVDALKIARETNCQTMSDIEERLNLVGKNTSKAKAEVKRLTNAIENMSFLKQAIEDYSALKSLCDNIIQMQSSPEKRELEKLHEAKLLRYKQAKNTMYRHKVESEEQIQEFVLRYEQMNDKLEVAKAQLTEVKAEYTKLSKLRYNVQLAQNKQYVFGPGYVEPNYQERETTTLEENIK